MLLRVISLVFLFIVKLRFPFHKSIATIIRERYDVSVLKSVRTFENGNFKVRKAELDLDFLSTCYNNNLVPNFLKFRLANQPLRNSVAYKQCQTRLLKEEIATKKMSIKRLHKVHTDQKEKLRQSLSFIDFRHICTILLIGNDTIVSIDSELYRTRNYRTLGSRNRYKNMIQRR